MKSIFADLYSKFFTASKADWSGWYGPSGRYIRKYDIHKIRESPAFTTLKAMGTRDLPSGQKMAQIRDAATIHCTQASAGRLVPVFYKKLPRMKKIPEDEYLLSVKV